MPSSFFNDLNLIHIAIGLFFSILFLQSGFDKVFDWKGNVSWLKGHFGETVFKGIVPAITASLTFVEIAAGAVTFFGVIHHIINGGSEWLSYGLFLSVVAFLMLFTGQRLAKDYAGASTIAIYFGIVILSLVIVL